MYKYIIICSDTSDSVIKRIKDLSTNWCSLSTQGNLVFFIGTKERYSVDWLIDTITNNGQMQCLVFDILTVGGCAAVGSSYTNNKTWDWLNYMCSNDINTIRKKIKLEEQGLIPEATINHKNKSEELYL